MADGRTFAADLGRWRTQTLERMQQLAQQSIQALAEEVVIKSPVLTGFFRGSWQPGLNAPPRASESNGQGENVTDPTGDLTFMRLNLTINDIKIGDTFYLSNNTKYGPRLEFGFVGLDSLGRYYNQPGLFFVTSAMGKWPSIVEATAAELNAR